MPFLKFVAVAVRLQRLRRQLIRGFAQEIHHLARFLAQRVQNVAPDRVSDNHTDGRIDTFLELIDQEAHPQSVMQMAGNLKKA